MGFIAYGMPEVFNKTGHGLPDIIIAWSEFKPVFNPGILCRTAHTSTEYYSGTEGLSWLENLPKIPLEYLVWLENVLHSWSTIFLQIFWTQ